jgi:hypothetical protein
MPPEGDDPATVSGLLQFQGQPPISAASTLTGYSQALP